MSVSVSVSVLVFVVFRVCVVVCCVFDISGIGCKNEQANGRARKMIRPRCGPWMNAQPV